ncbi:hypothetical protein [Streptomyces venezuelae]|uniref:Lipoprotein n=1 Tax=Streptomyces venezuelae TaxID=54571 RepID=A0A5P2B5E9_STRVZ|nr:hypothetical protein [Streptomyces venezuelae]QES25792.1 hypothetical protein DEJ47_04415 [Streptomyces venezuelae]
MRVRTSAVTISLLLAAVTACGSDDGDPDEKSAAAKPSTKQVDCTDEYLSQKEWMDHCAEESSGTGGDGTAGLAKTLKLGEPAETIGDEGAGVLQITPDTVVYVKEGGGEKSANGVFAVATMKVKAMTGAPAAQSAPITGDGWKWIAPDGEAIGFDSGNSTNVTLDKYSSGGEVQPGTYEWGSEVFDLTAAQAKGGTLLYTDGEGTAYRWKMPVTDTGPNVAEVKKQLAD